LPSFFESLARTINTRTLLDATVIVGVLLVAQSWYAYLGENRGYRWRFFDVSVLNYNIVWWNVGTKFYIINTQNNCKNFRNLIKS